METSTSPWPGGPGQLVRAAGLPGCSDHPCRGGRGLRRSTGEPGGGQPRLLTGSMDLLSPPPSQRQERWWWPTGTSNWLACAMGPANPWPAGRKHYFMAPGRHGGAAWSPTTTCCKAHLLPGGPGSANLRWRQPGYQAETTSVATLRVSAGVPGPQAAMVASVDPKECWFETVDLARLAALDTLLRDRAAMTQPSSLLQLHQPQSRPWLGPLADAWPRRCRPLRRQPIACARADRRPDGRPGIRGNWSCLCKGPPPRG